MFDFHAAAWHVADNLPPSFSQKECCLPRGGVSNPPSPPSGVSCPVSGWYWHTGKQCCVPHEPPSSNSPPPQCTKGCFWSSLDLKCYPGSTTTSTTPTPKPSSQPGYGYSNGKGAHYRRSELHSRNIALCPNNMEACPISGLMGPSGDYECLDTTAELESCGGCASTGDGQDCTAIEGAWNVACNQGSCAGMLRISWFIFC